MSRKARKVQSRKIDPDVRYNSVEVQMFINKLMLAGKKTKAAKILGIARITLREKLKESKIKLNTDKF